MILQFMRLAAYRPGALSYIKSYLKRAALEPATSAASLGISSPFVP